MYNQTTSDQQDFGFKGRGCGNSFNNKFSGPFGRKAPWAKMFGQHFANRKAVNIQENENLFIISLYAAGLVKSNFKITVSDQVLTISYNVPEATEADQSKFTYHEYIPGSFERSFQLNDKVLTDKINASYIDGVMTVTLPKNPETNKPAQEVNVN